MMIKISREKVVKSLFIDCLIKDDISNDSIYPYLSIFNKQNISVKYYDNFMYGEFFYKGIKLFFFEHNPYPNNGCQVKIAVWNDEGDERSIKYNLLDAEYGDNNIPSHKVVYTNKMEIFSPNEMKLFKNCFELIIKKQEVRLNIKRKEKELASQEINKQREIQNKIKEKLYKEVLENSFDLNL